MRLIWEYINLFRSVPALWMYSTVPCRDDIRADLMRKNYIGNSTGSWMDLHRALLYSQEFRNLFYFRTKTHASFLTKVSKLLYRPDRNFGIDAESIGPGMVIYHGNSSIVFAKTIGKNFNVYQQVTVGRGKTIDGNNVPIIGDNVSVYAGAIVVGGIRIGNNVSIGAGAVVTKDVPDNTTVVGAPVRMIPKQLKG